ncbi:hypothetical protein [Nocardiopsis rhodophaea]|uniref:hypothetical protein n=1 Tax=Nocardiopsis rhodophaea TaxID=280238 RepID=UPI0031E36FDC
MDTRAALLFLAMVTPDTCEEVQIRSIQQRATRILTSLLAASVPTVHWRLTGNRRYLRLALKNPEDCPMLEGHAQSSQEVQAFARYFGTKVVPAIANTLQTTFVVDGIGVRVWCTQKDHNCANCQTEVTTQ